MANRNMRWVTVGTLGPRLKRNPGEQSPIFTSISDLGVIIEWALSNGAHEREYLDQRKRMWVDCHQSDAAFFTCLIHVADKELPEASYHDFSTSKSRDFPKMESEGVHNSGHVIISKESIAAGRHLVLIEVVPGLSLYTVQSYFRWLSKTSGLLFDDKLGKKRRMVPQFDGYQSTTLREAIDSGTLFDIEFCQTEESGDDGFDEQHFPIDLQESVKVILKGKVPASKFNQIFHFAKSKFLGNRPHVLIGADPQAFVRVKTAQGQIKQTEVEFSREGSNAEILEQLFILRERIGPFSSPLPSRYGEVRSDVMLALKAVVDRIQKE